MTRHWMNMTEESTKSETRNKLELRHALGQADVVDIDPPRPAGLGILAVADADHYLLDRRHVHARRSHLG